MLELTADRERATLAGSLGRQGERGVHITYHRYLVVDEPEYIYAPRAISFEDQGGSDASS